MRAFGEENITKRINRSVSQRVYENNDYNITFGGVMIVFIFVQFINDKSAQYHFAMVVIVYLPVL